MKTKIPPLHPLLVGAYPVLALLAHNLGEIRPQAALRSLLVSLIAAVLLYSMFRLVTRSWEKAAGLTTLWLILFFSYGHFYAFLEGQGGAGSIFGRHRILAPLWLALAVVGTWLILKPKVRLGNQNGMLNVVAVAAVAFPLVSLASYQVRIVKQNKTTTGSETPVLYASGVKPDIYYIILDAYARQDILQEEFGLDNRPFLDALQGMGFYVASCSQSNYAQTELSLSSSLNFDYLENLPGSFTPGSDDRSDLWPLLRHSALRTILEQNGYTTVSFETGFNWSELEDAGVYLAPSQTWKNFKGVNGFEAMLVRTTAGLLASDALSKAGALSLDNPQRQHRDRILYALAQLEDLPTSVDGPKFVFAHIVAPHGPYLLGANGEPVIVKDPMSQAQYHQAYGDEVRFLNKEMERILAVILAKSATPPVIIVQGDHGHDKAGEDERMDILNVYYMPGEAKQKLYPGISPVNSFRLVLDEYFGAKLPLLQDRSFFSKYDAPFDFVEIPQGECR